MTSSARILTQRVKGAGAVWIWDPDRLRVLWADKAGLAFWGESSPMDLLERDFAPYGPIATDFEAVRVAAQASRDKTVSVRLVLAPQGEPVAVDCAAFLTPLPDGRQGIRFEARPVLRGPESELDRLREIIERAPFAVTLFAEDGSALTQNPAADHAFGPQRIGALVARFGGKEPAWAALKATLMNGSHSMRVELVTRFGRRAHRVVMRRMHDPVSGETTALMFFIDVNDRPETENLERASQAEEDAAGPALTPLMEALPAAVATLNNDLSPIFANPAAETLLGLRVGAGAPGGLMRLYPREAPRIAAELRRVLKGEINSATIDLVRRGEGGPRWVRASLRRVSWRGEERWGLAAIDVTEDRLALLDARGARENQTRALDSLGVGAVFVDREGRIHGANPAAAEILERQPHALTEANLTELLDEASGARLLRRLGEGRAEADSGGGFEATLRPVPNRDTKRLRMAAGRAARWTGAEVCVAFYEIALPASDRDGMARAEVIARVSHELRTPLTAVLGFAEMLLAEPSQIDEARAQEYVRDIRDSALAMKRLVDDLAAWRALHENQDDLDVSPVDALNLLRILIRDASGAAQRRQVRLHLSSDLDTARVLADVQTLRRAFCDLLTMAVAAAPEAGWVRVVVTRSQNGAVRVDIVDNGAGMSEAELEAASRPLGVEGGGGLPTGGKGGVGLALTRKLLEANGARFVLRSEPGVGTAAVVTFPPRRVEE